MSEEGIHTPRPRKNLDDTPHLNLFTRLKHFNLELASPGVFGFFFLTLCLIFFILFLDYRTVTSGFRLHSQTLVVSWLGFNGSAAGEGGGAEAGGADGNDIEKVAFLEQGGSGCNIFQGNWTWDESYPLYRTENCPFAEGGFSCSENGRPDLNYTKWRWQPKDCNLPRFDAKLMLEKLRNRRLAFIGDSIGRNQWESLLCMLSSAVPDKTSIYEVNGNPITKHEGYLIFKFRDFNCTIEYYRAPFIVVQGHPPAGAPSNVRLTLKLDQISWTSSHWKDADVLVFNSGHWWNNGKTIKGGCYFEEGAEVKMNMTVETAFKRAIETLVGWISREVNLTKTLVFFRSYAPVHYSGGDWKHGGRCHLETSPELGEVPYKASMEARMTTDVLMEIVEKALLQNVKLLNVTELTSRRKDGHSSLYQSKILSPIHRQDCSHWCLPGVPDTWNEFLYAVFLKKRVNFCTDINCRDTGMQEAAFVS